jgi:tripartite-type tricarboxylate transporter receptor subunit TctC
MEKAILALLILLLSSSSLQAQAPSYAGKTSRIVVGYTPGEINDLWARAIAQHMGKYIPGNPV